MTTPRDVLVVVCAPLTDPPYYADNVIAACATCARPVQHRPDVPAPNVLMCLDCARPSLANPETEIIVTAKTVREIAAYLRRN